MLTGTFQYKPTARYGRLARVMAAVMLSSVALLAAACGDDPPTTPTETPFSDFFVSIIGPQGSASRTFTIDEAITVKITLSGFTAGADITMGLGLGVPSSSGSGCDLRTEVNAKADGTNPHISSSIAAGTHCVKIFDIGELGRRTSTFTITIGEE